MPRQEGTPGPLARTTELLAPSQAERPERGWKQAVPWREGDGATGLGSTVLPREKNRHGDVRGPPERSRRCGVGNNLCPEGTGSPRDSVAPTSPRVCPPVRPGPPAAAGPWGRRGGGEGRPHSPSSFLGRSSLLHLERKRTPRVMNPSSFALTHPRPPLLCFPSPGRRISPHTPRRGGNSLTPGRSRENDSAPLQCSGARWRGRGGAAGHRGPPDALLSTATERDARPDTSPGPAALLPPSSSSRRAAAELRAPSVRREPRGAPPARQPPGCPPCSELPQPSDCLDFFPALKKIFPVIQISGK
ncbi:translation initiation factor IF-2-like isoform X1 [Manacus candei]|uniref:translation initiation factor IF-2-like isoform X1 n=1 Tax=Manacus candei TaxID=415023 RepID=UPI00222607BB|nr:translation initiation factor IF-2-like isoform X1 [Manacus candei]